MRWLSGSVTAICLVLLAACGGGGGGDRLPLYGIPGDTTGGGLNGLDPNLVIPETEVFRELSEASDTNPVKWLKSCYSPLPPLDSPAGVYQNASLKNWADQIFQQINGFRVANGMPPYQRDPHLDALAQAHARDMALRNFYDHINPYGLTHRDRFYSVNPPANGGCGENAAKGQEFVEEVVGAWTNSTKHRENIMRSFYTHTGVGVYLDPTDTKFPMHMIQLFAQLKEDPTQHDWLEPDEVFCPAHDQGSAGDM